MDEKLEALAFYRSVKKALKIEGVKWVKVLIGEDGELKAYIEVKTPRDS